MAKNTRVIFCTYSSLYSSIVLEKLIADKSIGVVGVINSTRIIHPKYGFIRGAIKQIQNSGFRYAAYLFMVTDLFRWFQPVSKIKLSVHRQAEKHRIPILNTNDVNSRKAIDFITKSNADFLLASHFNQLVKPAVLDLPNLECINVHPSLLPTYKGVDPVFYAMLDQQTEIGVTLHKMSEDFDSGKIFSQKVISTTAKQSLCVYNCQLFEEGVKLAIKWMQDSTSVNDILDVSSEGDGSNRDDNSDSNSDSSYDSWPSRKQVKQFKQTGARLIRVPEIWKGNE